MNIPPVRGKSRIVKAGFLNKLLERVGRLGPEDLQRALIALAKERGFFETIFNALQEGVLVIDPSGRITFLNAAAAHLFGIDPEESAGRPVEEIIPGIDWPALHADGETITRDLEIFYPENRFLNFYTVPLRIQSGAETFGATVIGHALIVRDLTESRRTAQETIESERLNALTLLAAGVAHEIGNPLNSLHIHLQLLERRAARLPADVRERFKGPLAIAREEIKRLDLIVTQFLGAIRPVRLNLRPSNINEIVRESVDFLSAETRGRSIAITQELRSDLPQIPADRDQLKQAFYNLLKNSFHAMREGGSLVVRTDLEGDDVIVSFEDDGCGISPETMARLFEPYFTTKKSGSGLGLLIVRRIAHAHGGDVAVESREGEGTKVRLRLPTGTRQIRYLEGGHSGGDPRPPQNSAPHPAEPAQTD